MRLKQFKRQRNRIKFIKVVRISINFKRFEKNNQTMEKYPIKIDKNRKNEKNFKKKLKNTRICDKN